MIFRWPPFAPCIFLSFLPFPYFLFLFLSASGTLSSIILRTFPFTLSLVTCITCARTRLTYIHEETSIIIDSKSRLKHRNAVACLYKIPKNTIPYHGLCLLDDISDCAMTVCWLVFLSVPVSSSTLDTSPREKLLIPDRIRAYPLIIAVWHFGCFSLSFNVPRDRQEFDSKSGRLDSRRIGEGDTRIEGRSKSHFYPFRPQDNRLPINIRVWLIWWCFVRYMFLSEECIYKTFPIRVTLRFFSPAFTRLSPVSCWD